MLSINLTIHNKANILDTVLWRIEEMTVGAYELVCVLDGCTDDSEKILLGFCKNNPHVKSKILYADDVFETKANNIAAKASTGDYIAIIQDDVWLEEYGWNKRIMKPFIMKDVFAVTGNCAHNWIFNPSTKHLYEGVRDDCWCDIINHIDHANRHNMPRDVFAIRDCVNRAPLCIDHSVLKELNYFDEIYSPQEMDDHDLCLRAKKLLGKIAGGYWIDYRSDMQWGGTRGENLQPKPWLFKANHHSVRIFYDRHRDYFDNGVRTIINVPC
jgi:glycosyltransferase involved in cell wall biosynthesis